MKLSDFDYNLPPELIAQEPASPRDHSRLLLLNKETGAIEHKHFYDIVDCFNKGDVLVMNNSKVFPARLWASKDTGGKMEVMLHQKISSNDGSEIWQAMLGGRGARVGRFLNFEEESLKAEIIKNNEDSTWDIKFNFSGNDLMKFIEALGEVPLPPYIKSSRATSDKERINKADKKDYQTVYANKEKVGSVAAPTAGLHFTPELLEKLKAKGVQIEYITLHVGLGTFAPVKVDDVSQHKMHAEWVEIDSNTIQNLQNAVTSKNRIITVGTTSTRTLEAMADEIRNWKLGIGSLSKWVDVFIYPGYKFKIVNAMITNFHLPKSTLIMLVSALAGKDNIDKAYQGAVKEKYRFYSYGDAMFIL